METGCTIKHESGSVMDSVCTPHACNGLQPRSSVLVCVLELITGCNVEYCGRGAVKDSEREEDLEEEEEEEEEVEEEDGDARPQPIVRDARCK